MALLYAEGDPFEITELKVGKPFASTVRVSRVDIGSI